MITLPNYIRLNTLKKSNNQTIFDKEFFDHLVIEHIFTYNVINEGSGGLFKDCEKIVNFIYDFLTDKLSNNKKKQQHLYFEIKKFIESKNVNNIKDNTLLEKLSNYITEDVEINTFFDKLCLDIYLTTNKEIDPSYSPYDKSNYNKKTDKLKECHIELLLPKETEFKVYSNKIKSCLTHELTHAYEDYNRLRKENIDGLYDLIITSNYMNYVDLLYDNDAVNQFVSRFCYYTNESELNAYIAELSTLIKNFKINKKHNVVNQLYELIKKTDVYKQYDEITGIVEALKNPSSYKKAKEKITNVYNKINGKNYSVNVVIKIIINKWREIQKRFNQKIPQIIYNYLKSEN